MMKEYFRHLIANLQAAGRHILHGLIPLIGFNQGENQDEDHG